MFGAAANTNKSCIATGGQVLASGEHVTGGLVAARSLAAARGLSTATAGSVDRVAGCINSLPIVFQPCTRYQQSVLMRIMLALCTVFDSR